MDKGILTSLQFIDYKLIAIRIFEEFALVEFDNMRRLTDLSNAYFSDGFCLVGAQ